jgi:hypothetical protein
LAYAAHLLSVENTWTAYYLAQGTCLDAYWDDIDDAIALINILTNGVEAQLTDCLANASN